MTDLLPTRCPDCRQRYTIRGGRTDRTCASWCPRAPRTPKETYPVLTQPPEPTTAGLSVTCAEPGCTNSITVDARHAANLAGSWKCATPHSRVGAR